MVVAEVAAVLRHTYGHGLDAVARGLSEFFTAKGVEVEDEAATLEALRLSETLKVDFVDAYVAVKAREAGVELASFDEDFPRKLGLPVAKI